MFVMTTLQPNGNIKWLPFGCIIKPDGIFPAMIRYVEIHHTVRTYSFYTYHQSRIAQIFPMARCPFLFYPSFESASGRNVGRFYQNGCAPRELNLSLVARIFSYLPNMKTPHLVAIATSHIWKEFACEIQGALCWTDCFGCYAMHNAYERMFIKQRHFYCHFFFTVTNFISTIAVQYNKIDLEFGKIKSRMRQKWVIKIKSEWSGQMHIQNELNYVTRDNFE